MAANDFAHNSVGPNCTQAEFELITGHNFNGQVTGDMLVALDANNLTRRPIGNNAELLRAAATPQWRPGQLIATTVYSSGSGSHVKNSNSNKLLVEGLAGGGGGGGSRANNTAGAFGAGGGSGAYFLRFITSPNSSYAYVVGAGGAGGANNGATGTVGANTTFDAAGTQNLLAPGGGGGTGANRANNAVGWLNTRPGNAGALATGNGAVAGDVFCQGAAGHHGAGGASTSAGGGLGGGKFGGSGGAANAVNQNQNGNNGAYGSGGGGAASTIGASTTPRNAVGGNGGNGFIIVWEFA